MDLRRLRRSFRAVIKYPGRHLRWKIIAPYAIVAVILAVAGTFLVTRLVTGSLRERFDNQLAEAARVTYGPLDPNAFRVPDGYARATRAEPSR